MERGVGGVLREDSVQANEGQEGVEHCMVGNYKETNSSQECKKVSL